MDIEHIVKSVYEHIKKPAVFFDIETTGLNKSNDQILQLYVAKYGDNGFSEYENLFNVTVPIGEIAITKHGITVDKIQNLPTFNDLAEEVYELFVGDIVICGYNHVDFDIPMIIEAFLAAGITQAVSLLQKPTLDALTIYREQNPNNLVAVYNRLTGDILEDAHNAKVDIFATGTVMLKLIEQNPTLLPTKRDAVDIGGFFKKIDGKVAFAKGKHKDQIIAQMKPVDSIGYLAWMIGVDDLSLHTKQIAKIIRDKLLETYEG